MEHCVNIRNEIKKLIDRHNLTKEEFCKRFDIKETKYEDYISGNRNYDTMDMAKLNNTFIELEKEKLAGDVPIQVTGSKP